MKLSELYLDGFGRLVNRTFSFAPGFNLVFGANEAGKSTLQLALVTMLYGFFDESSVTDAKRSTLQAFNPWNAKATYGGWLAYSLDDERAFRVERSFHPKIQTSLFFLPSNQDVSHQYNPSSHGRLFFADVQLGMNRQVFENTCSVRQSELTLLENSATAISDTILRLLSSGSADTTSSSALSMLEITLREEIGTLRARTKPLAMATARLAKTQEEQRQALHLRDELLLQFVEQNQQKLNLQRILLEQKQLRYLQSLVDLAILQQQMARADEVTEQIKQRATELGQFASYSNFPIHLHGKVVELANLWSTLQGTFHQDMQDWARIQTAKTELETQIAQVESSIARHAYAQYTPVDELSNVQKLAERRQYSENLKLSILDELAHAKDDGSELQNKVYQEKESLQSVLTLGLTGLEHIQHSLQEARVREFQADQSLQLVAATWQKTGMSEVQFLALEQQVQEMLLGAGSPGKPKLGCNIFLRASRHQPIQQTPSEVIIYEQIKPIYVSLKRAQEEAVKAHNFRQQNEQAAQYTLNLSSVTDLNEAGFNAVKERLHRHSQLVTRSEQQERLIASLEIQAENAKHSTHSDLEALTSMLASLGIQSDNPETALQIYLQNCVAYHVFIDEQLHLEELSNRFSRVQKEDEVFRQKNNQLRVVTRELQDLLSQAEFVPTNGSIQEKLTTFYQRFERYQRWLAIKTDYEDLIHQQKVLASSQSRTGVRSSIVIIESQIAKTLEEQPAWVNLQPELNSQDYVIQCEQLEQREATIREQLIRLQESITRTAYSLRHPAEIDEEITAARLEIEQLEMYRDIVERARNELAKATEEYHKQFAPRLEELASEGLNRITNERYVHAHIEPKTLNIRLTTPEYQEKVGVGQLSSGTRDQVYFMLRVGLARLMNTANEHLPLILDDPFVHYDRTRLLHTLEYLLGLANETQILLFTKDEDILQWFDQLHNSSSIHKSIVLS